MKVFAVLSLSLFASVSLANEKIVMSDPLRNGDCVVAFPVNGIVQYKSIKQSDAAKLDQKTSGKEGGEECSDNLKSSLSIEKKSECRILCNLNK